MSRTPQHYSTWDLVGATPLWFLRRRWLAERNRLACSLKERTELLRGIAEGTATHEAQSAIIGWVEHCRTYWRSRWMPPASIWRKGKPRSRWEPLIGFMLLLFLLNGRDPLAMGVLAVCAFVLVIVLGTRYNACARLLHSFEGRYCPECRYPLSGLALDGDAGVLGALGPAACPECGTPWPLVPCPPPNVQGPRFTRCDPEP